MTSVNTNAQVATQNTNINSAQGQSQADQEGNLDFLFMAELDLASMARLADVQLPLANTAPVEPEIVVSEDAQSDQELNTLNSATDPAIFADLSQLAAQLATQNNSNNPNISNKAQSNQDAIDSIASQATSAGIANQQLLNALNASQTQVQNPAPGLVTANVPNTATSQPNAGKNFDVVQNSIQQSVGKDIEPTQNLLLATTAQVKNDILKSDLSPSEQAQMANLLNSKMSALNSPINSNIDGAKVNNQMIQANPNVVAQALDQKTVTPQVPLNGLTRAEEATTKILYVNPNYDESINSPKSFISSVGAQNTADNLISNSGMRSMVESRLFENTLQAEKIEQKIGDEIMVDQAAGLLAGAGFSQPMHSGSLKLEATNTSLAAGPLYNEVMSAAKSGGGRIVLEVNPDNMGPIQIDLQIDQNGQALMIVNGASDATQARLEQGSGQLRQEFAQMGLNLSLDMRQNSASNHFNQGGNGNSNPFNNSAAQQSNTSLTNSNKLLNINTLSSNRSNADRGSSGVNLFA